MRIDNAELSGSTIFTGSVSGPSASFNITGAFSGSFFGNFSGNIDSASYATTASYALTAETLLGSVESSSFATTASQLTPGNGTASVSGHLIPTDSGSHDLGSLENPFRDLYITTASLNFVRNGQVVSVVNGGNEFIQVGNIIIGTSSISYASGSGGDIQNIISVDTASESNMVQFDGNGENNYTGSFTGSFIGDGSGLTGIAADLSGTNVVSQSSDIIDVPGVKIQYSNVYSNIEDLPSASNYHGMFAHVHSEGAAYFAHSGNWVELANRAGLVSGSVLTTASVNDNTLTFTKGDGTTFDLTVVTSSGGGGGGGESIASLNTFTSSIQSEVDTIQTFTSSIQNEVDALQTATGAFITHVSVNDNTLTIQREDSSSFNLTVITSSGGGDVTNATFTNFTSSIQSEVDTIQTFTSSIQNEVDALQSATGAYITNVSVNDNTLTVQRNDSSSFNLLVITSSGGGGGGESILALNNHTGSVNTFTSSIQNEVDAIQTFTSSIQNEVDALQNATGAFITNVTVNDNTLTVQREDSSSFDLLVITSSGGGGGGESIAALNNHTGSINTFTSSIQSEVDAIQTFTSSVQSEVDAIQGETGSYITNVSVNDNTLTIQRQDSSSYNLTVVTSSGGGGSTDTLEYNNVVRVTSGSASQNNYEMVVAGDVNKNLSWSRSSTTLTITHSSHGLSVGDVVHVRNTSVDYTSLAIQTTTTNEFTLTVANSGGTSGTEGVYVAVPRITTLDTETGAIVFENPSAGKVQMQTVKINMTSVESATINIDVPAGADDGFGTNDALGTRFIPLVTWYKVGDAFPQLTTSATITFSKTANHDRYSVAGGGIDTFAQAICMLRF